MLQNQIQTIIETAIAAAQADNSLPDFDMPTVKIERPKQADHGDYATNIALVTNAAIKKATGEKSNPREIAQAIVDHLPLDGNAENGSDPDALIGSVELAGPGFINLRLADSWLQQHVAEIVQAGDSYGNTDRGNGQNWQVEYVSANPTGPLHYGGARNAVIGDSLANVLEAAGYTVQREYYVNDGGTQFRLFGDTLYARYMQLLDRAADQGEDAIAPAEDASGWWRQDGTEENQVVPDGGYQGAYMIDYAREVIAEHGDKFAAMPKDDALLEMRALGRTLIMPKIEAEMERLGIQFDRWFSEQSLYDDGIVETSLERLKQKGDIVERDGAVWFLASNYPKNDKDEVVIRSDGNPTYFASDIAYHSNKFETRNFDRVINVWAVDHQGHVPRMNAIMRALELDPDRLHILMYDLVKLVRDGVEVKLSKRKGELISINDVVDEVGADALRFNLLQRSPENTIEFDMELAVAQNSENPVFFVQYSHARICSILRKAKDDGLDFSLNVTPTTTATLSQLMHPSELALIRKMLELEEQIDLAVDKLSTHNLTHYAIDLAKTFNAFYRDCKVVDLDKPELSQARLMLCQAARVVLARILTLVGVSTPEEMYSSTNT